jgi:hypothetical protein
MHAVSEAQRLGANNPLAEAPAGRPVFDATAASPEVRPDTVMSDAFRCSLG